MAADDEYYYDYGDYGSYAGRLRVSLSLSLALCIYQLSLYSFYLDGKEPPAEGGG